MSGKRQAWSVVRMLYRPSGTMSLKNVTIKL